MLETFTIKKLGQLKAIADPLRQRMMEGFSRGPITAKQLAKQLDENPTKLYHHVNALEEAGLIQLVETRQNRGTTEKYYRAVARQFAIDHQLLSMSPHADEASGELHAMLVNALEAGLMIARGRLDVSGYADRGAFLPALAGTVQVRISRDQAIQFTRQLQALLQAFQDADDEPAGSEYSMTLAFFPIHPSSDPAPQGDE